MYRSHPKSLLFVTQSRKGGEGRGHSEMEGSIGVHTFDNDTAILEEIRFYNTCKMFRFKTPLGTFE